MRFRTLRTLAAILGAAAILPWVAYAQEPKPGQLKISVSPSEAYTFVDDQAIGPHDRSISLGEGTHHVLVANYGFKPFQQDVSIQADKPTTLNVSLQPDGANVSGPWGRMQFEVGLWAAGDYAVLLNGKSAGYFVGHVDEFNNNIGSKQELIVPPGTYDVAVTRHGKLAWSGPVSVSANQRVIVDISNGNQRTKDWPEGKQLAAMSRFAAGRASASVVVAPVSATISASPTTIECGQNSKVQWASYETVDNNISGMSPVPPMGEATVSPRQTTSYDLTGTGPGGKVAAKTTVEVNPAVAEQFQVSPSEVHYRRIGDKVIEKDSVTLNWTTSNAGTVAIDPFGSVDSAGTRSMDITPSQSGDGPIDQTITYSLRASNACGGAGTKTTSVHITGSIEPIPAVLLNSIYFPTDYPGKKDPSVGLVSSQQDALTALASGFTKYLEYDPDAKLSIAGYADQRGPNMYNQSLSERRVQSVKDFLMKQGIAEDKLDVTAYGKSQQLDKDTVAELQTSNPNPPPDEHVKRFGTTVLAYNRRVDIALMPKNEESKRFYPNTAPDADILWQKPKPPLSAVDGNSNANPNANQDQNPSPSPSPTPNQ